MTSESTHLRQGRVHSARKRQGGRRDNDGLPTSFTSASERERQLGNTINDLRRQLHDALVANIVDLRLAGGLISESERSKSQTSMVKLSNEALEIIRRDLVKVLARINNATSIQDAAGRSAMAPYID